jgi:hypothetical protein
MPTDFATQKVIFSPITGAAQFGSTQFTFPSTVRKAIPALGGFSMRYSQGDHHFLRGEFHPVVTNLAGNNVTVTVEYELRDSSGNIDDPYEGDVDIVLIVDRD